MMLEGRARWEEKRRQAPDQPWLWRDDWAEGRIVWKAIGVRSVWIFALVFNGILGAVALLTPVEQIKQAGPGARVALALLPLAGLLLLAWAVRRTLRGRDYGRFDLAIETVPATPGGQLRGTVEAVCGEPPREGFDVRLTCLRAKVIARSGGQGHTTTRYTPVWQTVYNAPAGPSGERPGGVSIPVHFDIPEGLPETSREIPSPYTALARGRDGSVSISRSLQTMAGLPPIGTEWIEWRLTLQASLPTELSTCCFDVPVFEAPAAESRRSATPSFVARPPSFSSAGALRFEPVPSGGSQVVFPARSNLGWAIVCCLLLAIGASLVAWTSPGARETAGVIAGVAVVFAGLFVAAVMRSVNRIRVSGDEIAVTLGQFGLFRTRRWRADQVEAIAVDGMFGEKESSTFACTIRANDGTRFRFDTTLSTDSDVQTLLREIRDRLGLRSAD
jgi:hypothetical protein